MTRLTLLLAVLIVVTLPDSHALSSSEQTLQKVFADLIIRLKKWIHDNESELRKGMGAIRKHLSLWGIGLRPPPYQKAGGTEKTSNNIRPKPVRPMPTRRPRPTTRPHHKSPSHELKIPRWNPGRSRLSKSPYDPEYYRKHRRVGRAVLPLDAFRREFLIRQCLDIFSNMYALIHSFQKTPRKIDTEIEKILDQKRRDLEQMSTDQLKTLLKNLRDNQDVTRVDQKTGTVTIDGKPVDINNMGELCCPFG